MCICIMNYLSTSTITTIANDHLCFVAYVEPPELKCHASATRIQLTFDADAYQEKYRELDVNLVVVVVDINPSEEPSQQTNLSTTYIRDLDPFKSDINLLYYSLADGEMSEEKTINLRIHCNRPSALDLSECKVNSTNCNASSTELYLRFEEYEGSNRTVLEIELANNTMHVVNLTNETDYCVPGEVKKVVYYAVLSDGEQSLKSEWSKEKCLPSMCLC